jgi:hypothetical protein
MNSSASSELCTLARTPVRATPRLRRTGSVLDYLVMLFFLVFAYCSGTGNGAEASSGASPVAAGAPAPLLLRLVLPQRIAAGQPVPMTLVLENHGTTPVEVGLGGEPIAFDFTVRDARGAEIWRRLEGVAVESILHLRTVGPGETLEFADVWHQRDNRGRPIPPGDYEVTGILPVVDSPDGWRTDSETLRVEE